MDIRLFTSLNELESYAADWDRLAAENPFRGWTWLSTWAKHYLDNAGQGELCVFGVFDEFNTLVALAPWYVRRHPVFGSVVRMLGSGEVCSDYMSVLCQKGREGSAITALGEFLLNSREERIAYSPVAEWDLLEMTGVDGEDAVMRHLIDHLAASRCVVHRRSQLSCWRISLPSTWDDYLNSLSARFRGESKRLWKKYVNSGRAFVYQATNLSEMNAHLDLMIGMHQRRWVSRGEKGSFASPRFTAFVRDVLPQLMRQGRLHFYRLEVEGVPAATEYHITGGGSLYAYQTAFDVNASRHQPGKLLNLILLRRAIEQGYLAYDFMRGDEAYKAHFRAMPHASLELRVVPHSLAPLVRHCAWRAGSATKQWIKKVGQKT